MSKLQDLIDSLCPNGVEFKKLGNYIEIYTGEQFNKRDMNEEGSYPVINGGVNPSGYIESYNEPQNTITISQGGASAGFVAWQENQFWAGAHCYVVRPKLDLILNRFLFFFLKNQEIYLQQMQHGAGIPALNRDKVNNLLIPIPPLPVQEEIVRILDRFSNYAAELQAELQARKEQYEYYRNLLLTFNPSACGCGTDDKQKDSVIAPPSTTYKIQWKKMGEICFSLNTGLNPRQFFKLNTPDAKGYYVTIREIRGGRIMFNDNTDRINDEGLRLCNNRSNLEKGDVLFSGTGTIGQVAVITEKPTNWNIKEGVYSIKPNQEIVSSYFLRYILESREIKDSIMKKVAGGTVKSIPMAELKNILIPIPPIEVQEKIVAILDRFETLVNDISKGLPAEIEAQKTRYEYYRNKLLTFKPLPA